MSAGGTATHDEPSGTDSVIRGVSQNKVQRRVAILDLGGEGSFRAETIINAGNGITVPDEILDVVPFLDAHHPGAAVNPDNEREWFAALIRGKIQIKILPWG